MVMTIRKFFKNKDSVTYWVTFYDTYFSKGDIITMAFGIDYKVIRTPRNKWYHTVLRYITFGLFRTTDFYKIKSLADV